MTAALLIGFMLALVVGLYFHDRQCTAMYWEGVKAGMEAQKNSKPTEPVLPS